jgi:hypothetical protein
MKKIIAYIASIFICISASSQNVVETFDLNVLSLITKRVHWRNVVDTLKQRNLPHASGLIKESVYRNACEHIRDCYNRVWEYDVYFNRVYGTYSQNNQGVVVDFKYSYGTNGRKGDDLKSNIDTIQNRIYEWTISDSAQQMSQKQMRRAAEKLYTELVTTTKKYFGEGFKEEADGRTRYKTWRLFRVDNPDIALNDPITLTLKYNKVKEFYTIIFKSGN